MRKQIAALGLSGALLLTLFGIASARQSFRTAEVGNPQTGERHATVTVPETAVEVAPALFDLGTALDVDGRPVQGFAIVDFRNGYHHRPNHEKGGPGSSGTTSTCYAFLAKDAKWKTVEPWFVNPTNAAGLSGTFVAENLVSDVVKWEGAAEADILGSGTTTGEVLVADTGAPDGQNEVYFADVGSSGAIAVTIVWGRFGGPPFQRELVEWDQVYDDVDFAWSSSGASGAMDFENIATHELGHTVGLGHPDDSCTEETMYRFADFGETKKRTLEVGDITGAQKLY